MTHVSTSGSRVLVYIAIKGASAAAAAVTASTHRGSGCRRTLRWCKLHVSERARKLFPSLCRGARALLRADGFCEVAAEGTLDISLRRSSAGGHAPLRLFCSRPVRPDPSVRPTCPGPGAPLALASSPNRSLLYLYFRVFLYHSYRRSGQQSTEEGMDERIPHLQERHLMEHADFLG